MTALLHMNLSDLEKSPTIMFQSQLQMEALYYWTSSTHFDSKILLLSVGDSKKCTV